MPNFRAIYFKEDQGPFKFDTQATDLADFIRQFKEKEPAYLDPEKGDLEQAEYLGFEPVGTVRIRTISTI